MSDTSMKKTPRLIIIALACLCYLNGYGQFYNGHQMKFGKNRVQYYDYYWTFYRFDDFDIYFNEFGRDLAKFTADYVTDKLEEIEDFFDYSLEKRLIFIIHNKNAEYKQSNIGLVTFDDDNYNTGGYSRLITNKISLYYEEDYIAFKKQIATAITEVLVNEMLYNAEVKERVSSSSMINLPDWYLKGLANYVGWGWDFDVENRVKDGIMSGKYKNITSLEYEDAIYAGQSFWRYIGNEYGDALIPNIIYLTKVYRKIDDGILYVVGKKLKELLAEWQIYYLNEYSGEKSLLATDKNTIHQSRKEQIYQQVKISPNGNYIAYVTNDLGRKKIWLYDQTTEKQKVIFRAEPKYDYASDKTYPVLAWHPTGRILTFINEEKAGLNIYFYRLEEKSTEERNLLYFDKILDFSYSPEGTNLILSAVKDGMTDIYLHTIASGINEQITKDIADDKNPSFLNNSDRMIIFSSNRLTDTLTNTGDPFEKTATTYDLFTYDLSGKSNLLTRLTEGQYNDRLSASGSADKKISYIGNKNGVFNRYTATFDSTISFIDTTTHYRYFLSSSPVTNYNRNILEHSLADGSDSFSEIIFSNGRYLLRKGNLKDSSPIPEDDFTMSNFRKEKNLFHHKTDSIEQIRQWLITEDKKRRDTLTKPYYEYFITEESIDFNHYIFEKEKQNYYDQLWRKDYMDIDLDTGTIDIPLLRIYQTSFYNNYIANQIDFTFLNNAYQVYSDGSSYYNPGMNILSMFGITDLFEDYRITGGFRFSGNFNSNEYLFSVENLKGKFDKQFILHRQAYESISGDSLVRSHTHNVYLTLSKPFTPVFSLRGTLAYRYDRHVFLPLDLMTLNSENMSRHWATVKGEIIYDNTRKRSINIYYGTRFKIFGEYYKRISSAKSDMIVLGIDFRKYTRIHRELIWANRFAASTSYGPTKLLYYLGGVDNWMGYLFNSSGMFDRSIPVSHNVDYGFQAIATNMRGFIQNARNGTSFALINSEIRWPFVRYFAGHPLRSNFLNSLQIVGFGDIGTAWTGKSPWNSENAYDTEILKNGPVTVTLDSNRKPFIAGFGAGVRAQLAGYFIRADWAWGIEDHYILPRVFYLSFSLDF
ncbi:MAG: hypothetical protein GXY51_01775 [Bacteroidetes bacterium]|nr:hypothetical protein [Bacteroidota bacterium]